MNSEVQVKNLLDKLVSSRQDIEWTAVWNLQYFPFYFVTLPLYKLYGYLELLRRDYHKI